MMIFGIWDCNSNYGQAILFAKQFIELLKSWGQGEPIWSHFLTYVILVCVPVFLYSNISFMNGGFSHYGALQMIPIYQTYWIIFGTASGLVYFQEYKELASLTRSTNSTKSTRSVKSVGLTRTTMSTRLTMLRWWTRSSRSTNAT